MRPRSKTGSLAAPDFSIPGRLLTLVFCLPGVFAINHLPEVGLSLALLGFLSILLKPAGQKKPLSFRTFLWLTPVLVFSNALIGPAPRVLKILSLPGALNGAILSYRLLWAALITAVTIAPIPQPALLIFLTQLFGPRFSSTITATLHLVPHFADIRILKLRELPDAIARRLATAEKMLPPSAPTLPEHRATLTPADPVILLPAALCGALFIFC